MIKNINIKLFNNFFLVVFEIKVCDFFEDQEIGCFFEPKNNIIIIEYINKLFIIIIYLFLPEGVMDEFILCLVIVV